jgi:hypothetical protein
MTRSLLWAVRAVLVAGGLALWFKTQALLGCRRAPAGRIEDGLLELTAPLNRWLGAHPRWADRLLIASSAVIDALGVLLVLSSIFGTSLRPLLGLLILFALRQVCQGLCALPPPSGMIWRSPGFPSLLVTYGTASDLFFSGHTAIAVYGCLELGRHGAMVAAALAAVAVGEAATVLILRAHYTMDVFAGAVTACVAWAAAARVAPSADALLARLVGIPYR